MLVIFYGVLKFNSLLSGWKIDKVIIMCFMFYEVKEFN